MAKTRNPIWQPPEHGPCPQCSGSGEFQGMFHRGPCSHCHGTGYTDPDGEPLPAEDLIAMIAARRDHWREQFQRVVAVPGVKDLVEAYKERQQQEARDRAMGYGRSGKYTGD